MSLLALSGAVARWPPPRLTFERTQRSLSLWYCADLRELGDHSMGFTLEDLDVLMPTHESISRFPTAAVVVVVV
jgi:hypothetical protein